MHERLDAAAAGALARDIVLAAAEYGHTDRLAGQRINLEFVSANPTGPVHVGGVRWAAVGDALARLLRASGAGVGTEYYFNDAGSQIERVGLLANMVPVPAGYSMFAMPVARAMHAGQRLGVFRELARAPATAADPARRPGVRED